MILYNTGGVWHVLKIFQWHGSVFPSALFVALPCATFAAVMRHLINSGHLPLLESEHSITREVQAFSGFSFLVGFLVVFRTSQAYQRFWDGCSSIHRMRSEWFDACSAVIAFSRYTKGDGKGREVMQFRHTLVRLFSMLHGVALAELEDVNCKSVDDVRAFGFELIDPLGIDDESLRTIKLSNARVELIYEWIQMLIVESLSLGVLSIPPPMLSRAFQELANGMVAFNDAIKISYVPLPFPYAQTCDALLILHWIIMPFIVTQWVVDVFPAFVFTFVHVFFLWSLNFIAVEIENPFGTDHNDLDGHHMQLEMNRHLMLLLAPSTWRLPQLSSTAVWSGSTEEELDMPDSGQASFLEAWEVVSDRRGSEGTAPVSSARKERCEMGHFRFEAAGSRRTSRTHSQIFPATMFTENMLQRAGSRLERLERNQSAGSANAAGQAMWTSGESRSSEGSMKSARSPESRRGELNLFATLSLPRASTGIPRIRVDGVDRDSSKSPQGSPSSMANQNKDEPARARSDDLALLGRMPEQCNGKLRAEVEQCPLNSPGGRLPGRCNGSDVPRAPVTEHLT